MKMFTNVRILSIQSHVVSGYAGNKSACFPLQAHGFEVDAINSVQLSNHLGYTCAKGQILNSNDLDDLIDGLRSNKIDMYSHILTGFIGSKSFLGSVKESIIKLRESNPNVIYVCDPVMGDNGRMYVPKELMEVYRDEIVPLANIITPNQFEAELLTGMSITTVEDAVKVTDWFHDKGVQIVVLSSTDINCGTSLLCLASSVQENGEKCRITMKIPKFPTNYTGSGDLFTALLTAWLHKTNNNIKESVENVVATMQAVLTRTLNHAKTMNPDVINANKLDEVGAVLKFPAKDMELKIVQSLKEILEPVVKIHASIL